jgi:hypothetical protein
VSSSGNCVSIQDVELVTLATSSYVPPVQENVTEDPFTPENLCELNYTSTLKLEPLVENTLVYMSGFIIRKLLKNLAFIRCRELLISTNTSTIYKNSFILLQMKQCGGLIVPSDFCITTILLSEKYLRQMSDIHKILHDVSLLKLQGHVIKEMCSSSKCSDFQQHLIETQVGI